LRSERMWEVHTGVSATISYNTVSKKNLISAEAAQYLAFWGNCRRTCT